jgi:hypothetical protein
LVAALENGVFLLLSLRAVVQVLSVRGGVRTVVRAPLFLSSMLFVLFFSLAVGLATPNLGTISRYRLPALPFLVGVLVICESCRREAVQLASLDDSDSVAWGEAVSMW